MRIIIAVDLVLGPLLTLIVFKAGKPGLKFDLAAIGTFQALCLAAGTYIVYSERPLALIYFDGYFYSANHETYERNSLLPPEGLDTPAYLCVKLPEDVSERADLLAQNYRDEVPTWAVRETYVPLAGHMDEVMDNSIPLDVVRGQDQEDQLNRWLERVGGNADDYLYYPLRSRFLDGFMVINKETWEFVGPLNIPAPLWY
ncbi:MAG: hypothetical protein ISP91_14365 [Pseudomonadales bacterium]|nr:hypothetical protein [Pseudomonadales bacterium]